MEPVFFSSGCSSMNCRSEAVVKELNETLAMKLLTRYYSIEFMKIPAFHNNLGHSVLQRERACEALSSHETPEIQPSIIKHNVLDNVPGHVGGLAEASGLTRDDM